MWTNGRGGAVRRAGCGVPQIYQHPFRVVLLGDPAVGKSSVALRLVKDQFDTYQPHTIGASFLARTICVDGGTVRLEIWDTAGQERYRSLAPIYYRGAHAALVVYDVTWQESFSGAKNWVKELQQQVPSIVIALAGNKSDMVAKRMVDFEEAQAYADENGLLFMETSAKTAMNVNDIFRVIGQQLVHSENTGRGLVVGETNLDKTKLKKISCC